MRDCIDFLPCLPAWQFTPDRLNIFVSPLIKMELGSLASGRQGHKMYIFLKHHISEGAIGGEKSREGWNFFFHPHRILFRNELYSKYLIKLTFPRLISCLMNAGKISFCLLCSFQ